MLILLLLLLCLLLPINRTMGQDNALPIGIIQGVGDQSPYRGQVVTFRGVVTGKLEQENTLGIRYYTIFVQDLPEIADGDPESSDGIAVFTGRNQLPVARGDIVSVTGRVTEFYGLTEIDDDALAIVVENQKNPLPPAAVLDPSADNNQTATYYEPLESMRVKSRDAVVVGPTHAGCGFSVVPEDFKMDRVIRRKMDDPAGHVIHVLNDSDVDCVDFPSVKVGDGIEGIIGPLTYHFDRFKVVQQDNNLLRVRSRESLEPVQVSLEAAPNSISIVTFNLEDLFDTVDDTGDMSEPKLSPAELEIKLSKLAKTISEVLSCPTIIALQEVEKRVLLEELTKVLAEPCGFQYLISHVDGPDSRGLDVAFLADPSRVEFVNERVWQSCTSIETGIIDPTILCNEGEDPLFSRPPLELEVILDRQFPVNLIVNHFKSKRGGELETESRRLAQAIFINEQVERQFLEYPESSMIVLGDFNDYDSSQVMQALTASGYLVDGLASLTENERYSYNFDGLSQLVDWILISPNLQDRVIEATITHLNSDYPFNFETVNEMSKLPIRSSDHDIPGIFVQLDGDESLPSAESVIDKTDSEDEYPKPETDVIEHRHEPSFTRELSDTRNVTQSLNIPDNNALQPIPSELTNSSISSNPLSIISPSLILSIGLALIAIIGACIVYVVARRR